MTKTIMAAILSIAGLLFGAGPSLAVSFTHTDSNGDGVVSYEEAEDAFPDLNLVFIKKADRNRDGVIDKNEMPHLNSFQRFQKER